MAKPFYITTAIPYANAKPHIGYALECLYADVLARYWRQQGREVFFLMGTDEHGQKMLKTAKQAGQEPQSFADQMSEQFRQLHDLLNLTNTDFIRTTEPRHQPVAQMFWSLCDQAGDIYKKLYKGLYCVGCETFKTEKELVDGKCPDHTLVPELVEEENYFFRLSKYTQPLLEWYETHPAFVYPKSKFNEIKSLLQQEGLEDISISRSRKTLSWGIPVPNDPDQVMYVWFDALTNYLSAIGFGSGQDWKQWWPASIHVVGKEINRFHSALWPAMLMSAGSPLPEQIAVHGWITVNGQKMSKSLGNVLDPKDLVQQYGLEPIRYFLLREIPFERDGDFSDRRFAERYTADLANDLGNLLSRTTNMIEKYLGGKLDPQTSPAPDMVQIDVGKHLKQIFSKLEGLQLDQALEDIWKLFREGNALIDKEKPWELSKTNPERLTQVLYQLVIYLETAATALTPFLPKTAVTIQQAVSGDHIQKAQPLFPRLAEHA